MSNYFHSRTIFVAKKNRNGKTMLGRQTVSGGVTYLRDVEHDLATGSSNPETSESGTGNSQTLDFDNTPIQGSSNPVTSGGLFERFEELENELEEFAEATKVNALTPQEVDAIWADITGTVYL
jgi:hypothetical protein